jgi:thiamine-phosphate pyrophosphorylase
LKGVTTAERVRVGGEVVASLHDPVIVVMNDDVEAAAALGVAVHLGQGDPGTEAARREGIPFGRSAATVLEAREAEASGALYVGAGAVWPTPSKSDTGPPIGLDGLSAICAAVRIPVVAIGGVDSGNAGLCIAAGASGVAVIRGVAELPRLRAILDSALAPGVRERG